MNEILAAALEYELMGFSVIPCNPSMEEDKGKKPFVKWELYQKQKASQDEIKKWWTKWPDAMIGIVTGEISGLFVVDCDSPAAKEKIEEILPETFECPICQTPRGWHYYFKWAPGLTNSNNGVLHSRGSGGFVIAPPSKRSNGNSYIWTSALAKSPPITPPILINILKDNINIYGDAKNTDVTNVTLVTNVTNYFSHLRRNDDLFHLAYSLLRGSAKDDFVLQSMERIKNTFNIEDPNVSYNELKIILKSARDRFDRKDRNIASEVETWINEVTSGYFFVTSLYSELHLLQKEEKTAARVALHRMLNKQIIPGTKRGEYRILDMNLIRVDLDAPKLPRLEFDWPLRLQELIYLNPKSIVIIAGETNAGKSTFVVDFCGRNKDAHKIHLFSTEMGNEDIQDRLLDHSQPIGFWKNLDILVDRVDNFEDVLFPDDINIIDYLSVDPNKIWAIKTPIDNIFNKLKKGIAIICLQMGKGQEMPYGRSWGLERSRLAIALKHSKELGNFAEILKAKNAINKKKRPDGLIHKFLFNGAHICEQGQWAIKSNYEREDYI